MERLIFCIVGILLVTSLLSADSKTPAPTVPERSVEHGRTVYVHIDPETPDRILRRIASSSHRPAFIYHPSRLRWVQKITQLFTGTEPMIILTGRLTPLIRDHVKELARHYNFSLSVLRIMPPGGTPFQSDLLRTVHTVTMNRNKKTGITTFSLATEKKQVAGKKFSALDNDDFKKGTTVARGLLFTPPGICLVNIDHRRTDDCGNTDNVIVFSDSEKKLVNFFEK